MDQVKNAKARQKILRFAAALLADEISAELFAAMKDDGFLKGLKHAGDKMYSRELARGVKSLFDYLDQAGEDAHFELRAEYADLFLNAGPNPVAAYESVWAAQRPGLSRSRKTTSRWNLIFLRR
jgi:TorA maturation chaperone TorD